MRDLQTLLPENATALERAVDTAFGAYVSDAPVVVPTLWDADKCPEHLLGYLAWAVGVEEWDTQWPEETKRNAIREAPMINARRGTMWAVQRVLRNAGVLSTIREWYEPATTPFSTTTPGAFDITVFVTRSLTAGSGSREVTPEILERIRRIVDAAKPLSRHYKLSAALGIDAKSEPIVACVGGISMWLATAGELHPYHPSTHHRMALANAGTAWQYLPTSGVLQ